MMGRLEHDVLSGCLTGRVADRVLPLDLGPAAPSLCQGPPTGTEPDLDFKATVWVWY